jgi:hypothetical protein
MEIDELIETTNSDYVQAFCTKYGALRALLPILNGAERNHKAQDCEQSLQGKGPKTDRVSGRP